MKIANKVISLVLVISVIMCVGCASVLSASASVNPTFTIVPVSKDGNKIVIDITVSEGYINAFDAVFEMEGLECESIQCADHCLGNPDSVYPDNHITAASIDPVTEKLATVTLLITDSESFSFGLDVTSCEYIEDIVYDEYGNIASMGEVIQVNPDIDGEFNQDTFHVHSVVHIVIPAKCEAEGSEYDYCEGCKQQFNVVATPQTGHTEGEWVVFKEPTVDDEGIRNLLCGKCDKVLDTKAIERLPSVVYSVAVEDVEVRYKAPAVITPAIESDPEAEYTVEYSSSDEEVAVVDEEGNIVTMKRGTAEITCTVTDSNGNVVTDTCEVTVTYTWWQWIIKIVLLGFLWY